MKKINLLLFMLLPVFMASKTEAQQKRENASLLSEDDFLTKTDPTRRRDIGYWSVGGQVSFINYFGDLNPASRYVSSDLSKTRPSLGVQASRKWSPRLHTRFSLVWGRLVGDDASAADPRGERSRYRYMRNAHFRNDLIELAVSATWDLKASNRIYYKRSHTPYLMLGIALLYHNPKAKTPEQFGGKWEALRPLGTEGQFAENLDGKNYKRPYSLIQPVVPVGLGMRFRLSDKWDLAVEAGFRMVFTDYLDDVGGDYADPNDLSPLGRAMANRTLESKSALSGKDRTAEIAHYTETVAGLRSGRDVIVLEDGSAYPAIYGFGNYGDKRGESGQEDIYIITGFQLSYIVESNLRCPRLGKRRRK